MKKLIIVLISLSLTASCAVLRGSQIESTKPEKIEEKKPVVEIQKPSVGEPVVARWGPDMWAEGKVDSIRSQRAKILWADETSPTEVDVAEVFRLPEAGAKISVKAGEFTLVKVQSGHWWLPAEIKDVGENVVKARIIDNGEIVNLAPEKVLLVTPKVAADLKDLAAKEGFLNKARQHRPVVADGYQPKAGDRVLAEWTVNSWYPGRIKSVVDGQAFVVWDGGMTPSRTAIERIIPYPSADDNQTVAVNDYVLLKPMGGSWFYGQVTSVDGTSVEARTVDSTQEYKAGEYIVLR
jgi:hypothetical protein